MSKAKISKKEELFCLYFSHYKEPRIAAAKAGYSENPLRSAVQLLKKDAIKERLKELEAETPISKADIVTGLKLIAFGTIADALKFCSVVQTDEKIDEYDFSAVTRIRKVGNDYEIEFADRLKALEILANLGDDFYK